MKDFKEEKTHSRNITGNFKIFHSQSYDRSGERKNEQAEKGISPKNERLIAG